MIASKLRVAPSLVATIPPMAISQPRAQTACRRLDIRCAQSRSFSGLHPSKRSWDRGISGQYTRLLATKFPFARSESRRTPISALGLFLVFRWVGRSIGNSHGGHLWQVPMWRRRNFSFHFADRGAVVIASGYLVLGAGHTRFWLVDRCEYRGRHLSKV